MNRPYTRPLALLTAALLILLPACSRGEAPAAPESPVSSAGEAASSAAETSEDAEVAPAPEESAPAGAVPEGEIVAVEAYDGVRFDGKLTLPAGGAADKLVVFVNGSGPNTYDNRRALSETETFNYFDLFAREIAARGAAFFSYNTRGVTPGDEPPLFAEIDEKTYRTYTPSNVVRDMETVIGLLTADARLKGCRVYLLGWSEGTMIAPLVARRGEARVDGLLLAGYCNRPMADILDWQQTGGSSMVTMRRFFDYDHDGNVTEAEVGEDRYQVAEALGIASFADIDTDGDGDATIADFAAQLAPGRAALYRAIEENDDEWLAENYGVRLTSAWFTDHRRLAPNSETLPHLDLPIHIFQGEYDANTPVEDSYAIEKAFYEAGKTNLHLHVFGGHDHDLNYTQYLTDGTLSEGIQAIFDTIEEL